MRSATIPIIRFGFCRLCSGHWNQLGRLRGISNFFPTNHLPSRSFGFSCLMMFLQNQVVGFRLTVMYGTSRNVLRFEGFIYKRLRIMAYSPKLLCKHGLVYKTELLKSNTPSLLFRQTLFQCIRCIFLTPWSCPHQKFLTIESKFLQIASGTLKQEKV